MLWFVVKYYCKGNNISFKMSLSGQDVDIKKLPVNSAEYNFNGWLISYKQSHILHSQCSNNNKCEQQQEKCEFCVFNNILELPHMPDMVFPNNILSLNHSSGAQISFIALDALKRVSNGKLDLKVACSDSWKESRQDANTLAEKVKPFDWTFSTDYKGTIGNEIIVESTNQRIDMEKLRQREEILFYHDLTLFEDELHDNGIAVMNVKIRVMPSSFFILLRYFLRVDNVMLKINDTRYFYEKDTNYVLREYTSRESKVADLKIPPVLFTEPNEVAQYLTLKIQSYEKLILPSST